LSAAGFDNVTGLVAVAGFAVLVDFAGIGLDGEFDEVSVFTGDCRREEAVSEPRSSSGAAASTTAGGGVSVVRSPLLSVGLEMDFSGIIND